MARLGGSGSVSSQAVAQDPGLRSDHREFLLGSKDPLLCSFTWWLLVSVSFLLAVDGSLPFLATPPPHRAAHSRAAGFPEMTDPREKRPKEKLQCLL